AKSKGLFIMEAMWTCLLPGMKKLQELLDGGAIGQVLYMEADFGFQEAFAKNARLFNLELGGGALLDVGIYPLTLATFLFGKPKRVTANARLGQTGVDELSCYNLEFENRVMANLSSSIAVETSHSATIYGTEGTIHIPADWWLMEKLIITNGSIKEIDTSYEGSEYAFEVQEVCDCINNGQLESETLPHDWTRSMMSLMDDIRSQIGLVYPGEFIKA
ncbi:MAG: Gfo/Idh/MocA family oxidoreductase, partial [Lentisphaeraceae bacterium]|nr:Gfo/Idh/MocA family oxidoreductase [Lentisphaeraceae bacterium]